MSDSEDRARLDWIQSRAATIVASTSEGDEAFVSFSVSITEKLDWSDGFPTVRQAIDDAIARESAQNIPCGDDYDPGGHCPQ